MATLMVHRKLLKDYHQLPVKVQKKVAELIDRFNRDSKDPGIHLHPLPGTMLDAKVRGANLVDGYRAIIIAPEAGDTFLLVHVDSHDKAYDWAKNKRFEIHGATGSFQVFDIQEVAQASRDQVVSAVLEPQYPLTKLSEEALFQAGVPRPLIPSIKAVANDDQFLALAEYLPTDCRQILRGIAQGLSLDQALQELLYGDGPRPAAPANPGDFSKLAESGGSDFVVVDGERAFHDILQKSLDEWRVFLHPYQSKVVKWQVNGAMSVTGSAGTGKTVALMHRAVYLAHQVDAAAEPKARILVTTFTTTLSVTLRHQIEQLDQIAAQRIEVTNLHALARTICSRTGWRGRVAEDEDLQDLWEQVWTDPSLTDLPLSRDELRSEFHLVVDPAGIDTEDEYVTAVRSGRPPMKRDARRKAWPVFVSLRRLLKKRNLLTFDGCVHEARMAVARDPQAKYTHVLVDEIQDFSLDALRLIAALSRLDGKSQDPLTTFGDGHQRIYGVRIPLSRAGIDVRGRSRRLKINYRTTEQIRMAANKILTGAEIDDLNGGIASTIGDQSIRRGPVPKIVACADKEEEAQAVVTWIQDLITNKKYATHEICITPGSPEITAAIARAQVPTLSLRKNMMDPGSAETGVRLGSMRRIKGLEFRAIAMTCASPLDPYNDLPSASPTARCERYVAATRARDHLLITTAVK